MGDFKNENFVTRSSQKFTPFTYKSFSYTYNTEHCSIHCFFDENDNCDFHFIYNGYCYLGNFNTETPISSPSGTYTMYIFKGKFSSPYGEYYSKAQWKTTLFRASNI